MEDHKETIKDTESSNPSLQRELSRPPTTDTNSDGNAEDMTKGTAVKPESTSTDEEDKEKLKAQQLLNTAELSSSPAMPVSVDSRLHVVHTIMGFSCLFQSTAMCYYVIPHIFLYSIN